MVEIILENKKGEKKINSTAVEEILSIKADLGYVKDISDSIKQKNIMVFDCKLDKSAFKYEFLEEEDYEEYGVGEEYLQVLFEDIKAYLKDISDDVEDDLQEEYKYEDIKCHFEIYDLDETFTDVKFVLTISFGNINRAKLMDLTRHVSKRQLQGSSKYFN
ncbi:hypothetical protein [Tepidibacter formicigenes]|jgi:hypothetical protein|uniref:Uncharacterized protein n=1 Tax=Tepidibacter formicigenes DSM 15518 TaxID=1123349 RepID=A0A1M6N935_9FIRM|nr:hypothetical protein [Tepidibacter formicigenes]SHJ92275.1 hypothetical protein SAMN02744037_01193 [Tepidibacter formicigenes DSM 15518]